MAMADSPPASRRSAAGHSPQSVAVGDFNGDGKLDIVTADQATDNVSILIGDGHGGFTAAITGLGGGRSPQSVAVGDLNGDGKLDIVTADQATNNVSILIGDGHGQFSASTLDTFGDNPVSVALADINQDGSLDLVVATTRATSVFGSATGRAVSRPPPPVSPATIPYRSRSAT